MRSRLTQRPYATARADRDAERPWSAAVATKQGCRFVLSILLHRVDTSLLHRVAMSPQVAQQNAGHSAPAQKGCRHHSLPGPVSGSGQCVDPNRLCSAHTTPVTKRAGRFQRRGQASNVARVIADGRGGPLTSSATIGIASPKCQPIAAFKRVGRGIIAHSRKISGLPVGWASDSLLHIVFSVSRDIIAKAVRLSVGHGAERPFAKTAPP